MSTTSNFSIPAFLLAFFGAIFFSAKAVIIKLAYVYDIQPTTLLLLRMLFALPFYLIIGFWSSRKKAQPNPIRKVEWIGLILLGFCGYYLASIFDFMGLQYITASLERLILFMYPTIVLLFSSLLLKKKLQKEQLVALLLSYAGIIFAFADKIGLEDQSNIILGAIWIFGSALTYAMYLIGSEKLIPKLGVVRFTAFAMSISSVCVIIQFLIQEPLHTVFELEPVLYGYGFMLGIGCTVIPSFMVSKAIGMMGSANTSIVASVGPISTIVLAGIFLNEQVSLYQMIGTAVVMVGVLYLSLQSNKRNKAENLAKQQA